MTSKEVSEWVRKNCQSIELLAFRLFINKKVNIGILESCFDVNEYNDSCSYEYQLLTKEEYIVLKKVLEKYE